MSRTSGGMRGGIFGVATAAALAFGAAQALAQPGAAARDPQACNGARCRQECRSIGYDDGRCDQGGCVCLIVVPTPG
ncbi:MAG TPA: hypothetical protein VGC13_15000 [Longimicrobium sp.]|uniref:hypothetical protein n=1 Tax=Longimicrobium sp. TaxID=2029185 RepID=UPI002EDA7406